MSEKEMLPVARAVLQQCLHAKLQVKPAEQDSEAQFVEVSTADWCHFSSLMVYVNQTFVAKKLRMFFKIYD